MTRSANNQWLLAAKNLAVSDPTKHLQTLGMLAAASGWMVLGDDDGPLVLSSPCHRIGVGYETASAETGQPQLVAVARSSKSVSGRWYLSLNGHVPVELIAVLMTTLQRELDRDGDALIYGVGDGQAPLVLQYDESAWTWQEPEEADGFAFALLSADGTVAVFGQPFADRPAEPDGPPEWLVVASAGPESELWSMRLGRGVPHHVAARLLNHLLDTTPVLRPGADPTTRERI